MKQKYLDFDKLNRLLVTMFGAEKLYYNAAQDAQTTELKRFFNYMAVERNKMAHDISNELHSRDIEPLKDDIEKGNVQRTWHEIKEALENFDAETMINECMGRDRFNIRKIDEILESRSLPDSIIEMLEKQRKHLDWYLKQAQQHKSDPFKKEAATRDEFFKKIDDEDDDIEPESKNTKVINIKTG